MEIDSLKAHRLEKVETLGELNATSRQDMAESKNLEKIRHQIEEVRERVLNVISEVHEAFERDMSLVKEEFLGWVGRYFDDEKKAYKRVEKRFAKNRDVIEEMKGESQLIAQNFLNRFKAVEESIQKTQAKILRFDKKALEYNFLGGKYMTFKKEYFKKLEKSLKKWSVRFRLSDSGKGLSAVRLSQRFSRDQSGFGKGSRDRSSSRLYSQLMQDEFSKSFRGKSRSRTPRRNDDHYRRSISNSLVAKSPQKKKNGYKRGKNRRAPRSVSRKSYNNTLEDSSIAPHQTTQEASTFSINSAMSRQKPRRDRSTRSRPQNDLRDTNSLIERKSASKRIREPNVNRRGREFMLGMGRTHSIDDLMKGNDGIDRKKLERDYRRKQRIQKESEELKLKYNLHPSRSRVRLQFEEESDDEEDVELGYRNREKSKSSYQLSDNKDRGEKSGSFYNYEEDKEKVTNPSLKKNFMQSNISPVAKVSMDLSKNKDWKSVEEALSNSQIRMKGDGSKKVRFGL